MAPKACIKYNIKRAYGLFLSGAERILGLDGAKLLDVWLRFGRRLNLKKPRTLADKVSYISLHGLTQQAVRCTDKWEARRYVASKGLEEILVPVYTDAVCAAEDLDFDSFPDSFVLKATHGSGMNYFCVDKASLNRQACLDQVRKWLDTTYGTWSVEPHYRKLSRRVYCEAYLAKGHPLMDIKIHCIHGKPSFIQVCSERKGSHVCMYLFDPQWNRLDMLQPSGGHVPGTGFVEKPRNLEELLRTARILAGDFAYVRVDLYEVDGRIWFGELTFTPDNGVFGSFRTEFLEKEGEKLSIKGM